MGLNLLEKKTMSGQIINSQMLFRFYEEKNKSKGFFSGGT